MVQGAPARPTSRHSSGGSPDEPGTGAAYPPAVALPVLALALVGLLDLAFERIVYRIGIHVPRDASLMPAYEGATAVGDGAFRYGMVLAAFAAIAAAVYLMSSRHLGHRSIGAALAALVIADTLTIGWSDPRLGLAVNGLFAGTLALLMGIAWGRRLTLPLQLAAAAAGLALVAGQYPLVAARLSGFSEAPLPGVAASLSVTEAAVVAAPMMLLMATRAWRRPHGRWALSLGIAAAVAAGAAWLRSPSTVAILSLWGVGVTMSFPAPVYAVALGAAVAAVIAFGMEPEMRHLAVAIILLLVAGVQPTVTQYNLAATLGMAILVFGGEPAHAVATGEELVAPGVRPREPRPALGPARGVVP